MSLNTARYPLNLSGCRFMRPLFFAIVAVTVFANPAAAASALYRCSLGVDIVADYSADAKSVTIFTQGEMFHLPVAMSGSGARYSDGKTTLWEHQGQAQFETPGASFTGCRVVRIGQ